VASAALVAASLASGLAQAAEVTVDRTQHFQTIEGFGFFGGADVWWSSADAVLDVDWTHLVIDDLGATMWRNEYYPSSGPQDADWDKQRPVVQALTSYAAERHVPLKVILTVWSPPAEDKCIVVDNGDPNWWTCANPLQRPADTKGGNILDPGQRPQLAQWLIDGLGLYKDIGVDVYALSFQNEPLFWESYNSCFYAQQAYSDTLAAIGPTLKAAYPNVKLFGSENMLGIECGAGANGDQFDNWWYTASILDNPTALGAIDAFAVHGYVDGVSATATSKLANLWSSFRSGTASSGKSIWMTETSGYFHEWPGSTGAPGGLDLAQAIYAALYYGHLSAWTYWQGSDKGGASEYSLMAGTQPAKNYYVAKQFYRYIRPGAQMVQLQSDDPGVMVVAFDHPTMGAFSVVAINTTDTEQPLTLTGAALPTEYQAIRTSATEDAADLGTVSAGALSLPPKSVTTLVHGNVYEELSTGGAGTGGTSSGGGSAGTGSAGTGIGGSGKAGSGTAGLGGAGDSGAGAGLGGTAGTGAAGIGTAGANGDSGGEGCGCRAAGGATPRVGWILGLGVLALAMRRRRAGAGRDATLEMPSSATLCGGRRRA